MKTILITCHKCEKSFQILTKEYNRQIKNGRTNFYCSRFCSASLNHTIHHKLTKKCVWCHTDFETTTHKRARKYCSRDCIQQYARTHLDREKLSNSLKKAWDNGAFGGRILEPKTYNFVCIVCNKPFQRITKKIIAPVKTCSNICQNKLRSINSRNNLNCGGALGYRRFKYNGFTMDSRWEVELAKWMDDNGIKWDRSRKRHMFRWVDGNGDERKYFPDFYLPDFNVYLDPKNNYYLQRDFPKLKYVMDTHKITLFYGGVDDIKSSIDKVRMA